MRRLLSTTKQHRSQLSQNNPTTPPAEQDSFPGLFRRCGQLGRGMGLMRRIIRPILSTPTATTTPLQITIIEAYIENLLRWNQPHRAWALLTRFDFGAPLTPIAGRFAAQAQRIRTARPAWKPSDSARESLLAIYLIRNRPDLALAAANNTHSSDQATALLICARAATNNPLPPRAPPHGPITAAVLAKYFYRTEGPAGLTRWLEQQQPQNPPNRRLLSAWLDILLLPTQPALEPVELAGWIQRLDQHGLLGERELESYLRYTRQWLESQTNSRIKSLINHHHHHPPHTPIAIDPNHPSLGYPQLIELIKRVYQPPSTDQPHHAKPSTIVVSEMVRIFSLVGTPPEKLAELIDREVAENQSQLRSSHIIGLAWSRIINHDLPGLHTLLDREIKLKYKLVLTGLLTTIILAALIATRAPKPMLIKISQKLIEQCPTTNSQQNHYQGRPGEATESVEGYLALIKAAEAVGDWILIKELHEALLARFGREALSAPDRPFSVAYLHLIFQVYMKLNEPLLAQKELALTFDPLRDHYLQISSSSSPDDRPGGEEGEETTRFLSSGVVRDSLDTQTESHLVPDHQRYRATEADERAEYARLVESVRRAALVIEKKLAGLARLRRLFARREEEQGAVQGEKGELEWQAARLAEIDGRLHKFSQARLLNLALLARLNPLTTPPHPAPGSAEQTHPENQGPGPRAPRKARRDLAWNQAMLVALGLLKNLLA
ncbi:hypothetical protein PTTG_08740 [Puccinia triticina 1-1 BBBD Race 1]|uniref:Uncharacterized protein n=1 Tax=Puccinia triticina (isolate 1-1 / race 1 (BBBD)) TaxID=630390 RepID=A0A180GAI4_PUCT1|nr:hypothetical protein PTTG_08740 [Puccinia triticina 1-1 BBBD Race 1]